MYLPSSSSSSSSLFDSPLCDVFPFLDATRRVVFVVLRRRRLRRRRRHTENTPYRGVTVRWARPLTAPFPFTFTVLVSSTLSLSTHVKRQYRGVTVRLGRPLTAVSHLIYVVVVVVVLFDLTLSTFFSFSRRDLTCRRPRRRRLRVAVVVVFVVVAVTRKNTSYRGVTVRLGRPLTTVSRTVSSSSSSSSSTLKTHHTVVLPSVGAVP